MIRMDVALNGYEALAEEKNDGVRKDVLIIL